MDLVKADLGAVQHVSVAVDASNHKAVKLIPIVIRYFKDTEGVQVKILDFTSIPGETSDILVGKVSRSLRSFNLMDKEVGYCADNTNANFGGRARVGVNNVFYKLNQATASDLVGVGCAAHIAHNAL